MQAFGEGYKATRAEELPKQRLRRIGKTWTELPSPPVTGETQHKATPSLPTSDTLVLKSNKRE